MRQAILGFPLVEVLQSKILCCLQHFAAERARKARGGSHSPSSLSEPLALDPTVARDVLFLFDELRILRDAVFVCVLDEGGGVGVRWVRQALAGRRRVFGWATSVRED